MATDTASTGNASGKSGNRWDVIVIGGGVVGCAITRRFALAGARTLLLERGGDILSGASKANSAPSCERLDRGGRLSRIFVSNVTNPTGSC